MKSRRWTYLRLWVKKSALSSVDEMLLLSFELKETLGKIRPTYYEEQAFTYRLWVKKSALSSVDETLFLQFELKRKFEKADKTNIFRPLKQKIKTTNELQMKLWRAGAFNFYLPPFVGKEVCSVVSGWDAAAINKQKDVDKGETNIFHLYETKNLSKRTRRNYEEGRLLTAVCG